MDEKRAREIASLPTMVNVTHNGKKVYIEYVNESNHTASVHELGQHDKHQEVPLNSLIEG